MLLCPDYRNQIVFSDDPASFDCIHAIKQGAVISPAKLESIEAVFFVKIGLVKPIVSPQRKGRMLKMSAEKIYEVSPAIAAHTHIDSARYRQMYDRSIRQPDQFWAEQAEQFLTWSHPWQTVSEYNFSNGHIRWFTGAKLNVSYNCLDRHLETRGDQTAIIWEGDDPEHDRKMTYRELHQEVCRFSNALKRHGVKRGDRVCIYMPMIPETAVAMLACTRIGAIHSIVFGGFSAEALKDRIQDADCHYAICSDQGRRGGKKVPLKGNVDTALASCPNVKTVFVVKLTGEEISWTSGRDVWYHEAIAD
jgi:acetyl-CoA synthetase